MNQMPPAKSGVRIIERIFAAAIAILIAAVFVFIIWFIFTPPKIVAEADAGFKRAKQTINPEELRKWALDSIQNKATQNELQESLPVAVKTLYSEPPYVRIEEGILILMWGGGFFHWEFDIGPTNYSQETGVDNHFTTLEWVPGIYYSREDTRHPFK